MMPFNHFDSPLQLSGAAGQIDVAGSAGRPRRLLQHVDQRMAVMQPAFRREAIQG
ncbi:hypothetical protein D3C76_1642720 [compost metagenome]